jgi:arylsulfatase A-like enzyme
MTLNIDLNPTVLEIANLKPLASAQGRSLVPLLRESNSDTRHVWFIEHHFPDGGWIPSSEGIRTKRWKYLRYIDVASPFEELYDLDRDPHETINLAGEAIYAREQSVLTTYWRIWRTSLSRTGGTWQEPVTEVDLQRDGLS